MRTTAVGGVPDVGQGTGERPPTFVRMSRPPVVGAVRGSAAVRAVVAWLPLVAVVGVIGGRRWWQHGAFVSGLDGGSWFAFGRPLLGEEGGKPTPGAYPPLVPFLMGMGRAVADPMIVAKAAGVASLIAVVLATYVVAAGGMNRWLSLTVATTVGLAGMFTEAMVFGGYPQNVAVAFLLLGALGATRFLGGGGRGAWVGTALALTGAAVSHHTMFAVTCLVVGLVWVCWASTRPARRDMGARTVSLGLALGIAGACFVPTLRALRAHGYDPPLNANDLGRWDGLLYAIREAPWFWGVVIASGALFVGATFRGRREPTWQVAAALMTASLLLFPPTAEPRTLAPIIVGASLGVGLALQAAWGRGIGGWRFVVPLLAATLPVVVGGRIEALTPAWYDYYRVVDGPLLDATAFVDERYPDGIVVAVREDRRGWATGWWFEGLTRAEVLVGAHERWLAFPSERANARLVDELFERGTTTAAVADLAARYGIDLLVFRKWEWIGWERWLEEPAPAVEVVYDDGTFMALRIGHGAAVR